MAFFANAELPGFAFAIPIMIAAMIDVAVLAAKPDIVTSVRIEPSDIKFVIPVRPL
jgi:hypothetical protein